MKINFEAETPEGQVTFHGELTKVEVDFLLQFAIMQLFARGVLPIAEVPISRETMQ
jgi:hypothetical protein